MPKKILIVDDERGWVETISSWLADHGYQTAAAFDTLEALAELKSTKPDLVLLDIIMPAGGGITVLKAIRADTSTSDLPVIVITARMEDDLRQLARKLKVSDYLVKPIDMAKLLRSITKQIGHA